MYLTFVAYHGTVTEEGTERIAQSLAQSLTLIDSPHNPYCGPSTDENTFEQHMTEVIPYSQLFILVVNDFCPQENGRIDQRKTGGGAGYLCEEVKAFRNLIKRKTRNVKDFAVYYCGNRRKTYDEIVSYVRTLLQPIDPDDTLYKGNDRYIIELKDLTRWVNTRIGSAESDSIFSDEYQPFEPLEQKIKETVANGRGALLIEMKRGMGKTRFVNHIKRDLYPDSTVAIHFTRDQGYVSLGKFRSDFVAQLKEHLNGGEEPVFLDDYGELNRANFARYINDFKSAAFADKPLVICLDSADDCKPTNQNGSALDLFGDLSLFDDGIVFLFTSKIPENGERYSHIMNAFLETFTGERITVDENNMQYLQFLYFYFTNHILSKFGSDKVSEINPRSLFNEVKPKDMLSFSILFRVVNLYLSTTADVEPKIIASIEEALKFYYSFLREHTKKPLGYDDFMTALVILSLSDRPLDKTELDAVSSQLLNRKVSDAFIKNTSALSILVNTVYGRDGERKYEIRHEKIRDMIEHDNETYLIRTLLFDNMEFRLDALGDGTQTLLDFVNANSGIIYLIRGYVRHRNDEKTILQYWKSTGERLSHLNWGDGTSLIAKEQDLLSFIVNSACFEQLSPRLKAKYLTRIAIDEMLLCWNSDSHAHFKRAYFLWREMGEENLSDEDLYSYFDFLTAFGNCLARIDDDELTGLQVFKAAVDVSRALKAKNIIPLRDFTNNLLAYGNIQTMTKRDFAADKLAIDEARELLENSIDPMDLGQLGWLHQRISYWYECQGDIPQSRAELKCAMEAYEYAFDKAPDSFYFGNYMITCAGCINAVSFEKPYEQTLEYMKEKEKRLFIMAKQKNFFSAREESIFYGVLGDVYLRFGRKNEALMQYNKAVALLQSAEKDNGVVDDNSKLKHEFTEKINAICG